MAEHSITFRPASDGDTTFARSVHKAAYQDVVIKQFGSWDDAAQGIFFAKAWNNPGFQIISCDGEPCGYCRIEDKADAIKVHELVLLPQFQGQRIGTNLLAKVQSRAAKQDVPVNLEVLKFSSAIGLYERIGFKKVGSNDTHFEMSWSPRSPSSAKV